MAQRLPIHTHRPAFTIVASRSHQSPETEAYIRAAEAEHGTVQLTSMGSALKICLVAEGVADAYPRHAPTMEWDTAAGHAIANEAGRRLIDVSTSAPMRYNKHELVNQWFIVH
jgi:3'(2'), 5'-bisphosphate nucleotidase